MPSSATANTSDGLLNSVATTWSDRPETRTNPSLPRARAVGGPTSAPTPDEQGRRRAVRVTARHGTSRHNGMGRLVFRSLRIRTKLAVALVVPLVALAVLSLAAISAANERSDDAAERARTTRQQVDLATASIGPGGLISALQSERNVTSLDLIGLRETLGEVPVDGVRAVTDTSLDEFRATIAG